MRMRPYDAAPPRGTARWNTTVASIFLQIYRTDCELCGNYRQIQRKCEGWWYTRWCTKLADVVLMVVLFVFCKTFLHCHVIYWTCTEIPDISPEIPDISTNYIDISRNILEIHNLISNQEKITFYISNKECLIDGFSTTPSHYVTLGQSASSQSTCVVLSRPISCNVKTKPKKLMHGFPFLCEVNYNDLHNDAWQFF